jgi:ABC-type Fe3+-hydroxamate transport system substrate-binding protein
MPVGAFDTTDMQIYHPPRMGQRSERPGIRHFISLLASALVLIAGCDRRGTASNASTRPASKRPTVASLSPAGTDILVAIGAQDHLIAVSNYDLGKPAIAGLLGAGDYLTVDWERLSTLRPDVLVVQAREEAAPAA